jgi:PAS domain S-box-containing protein
LGVPEAWPQPLKTIVGVMLGSNQPMFVAWGLQRTLLYNDAYSEILADKHPNALGGDFLEVWSEIRSDLAPMVEEAYSGRPVHMDDIQLVVLRRGHAEEAHFAFSYTPVRNEAGQVAGMFCACTETTAQVLADRHAVAERERLERMFEQAPGFMAMLRGPEHRIELTNPAYQRLIGHRDVLGRTVAEALPEAAEQGYVELLDRVYRTGEAFTSAGAVYSVQAAPGGRSDERHVDFVYQPVRGADGAVEGIFVEGSDITERVRAEAALREIEELNRRVLTSSSDCIKLLDRDGRLLTMSEGGQRALGIEDLQPFVGTAWAETFEQDGREAAQAGVLEAREGRTARFEAKLRTQAGVLRDWDTVLTPVVGEHGRPERILALSRDITERREAEAVLRESEARRAFLLNLGDLTRRLSDPAKIVEASTRALGKHLGVSRVVFAEIDEAAGQATARGGWTDGMAAHLPEVVRLNDYSERLIAHLRSGGTLCVDDVRHDERTRESLPALEAIGARALVSAPLIRDGLFVANLNIYQAWPRHWTDAEAELIEAVAERTLEAVERARADAALRASEARFAAIFAQAPVGLSEIDLDGRVVSVNGELCAMLGRSREEVISATIAEITHPEDVSLSLERFQHALATGQPVSFDKRYVRRDSSVVWANSNLTRLDDEDGRPRGVLAVTVDLTERQAQEAALREETRTLETLNRTGAQLAGELDLDRLLQLVTDASVELTGAKFGAYFHNEMDETGERLHLFTLSGAEREAFLAMGRPRATAIFGPTFRNETVIRSDDILTDPRYGQNVPHRGMPEGHLPVRSYLAIPVVSRTNEVLGGLIFGHPEPGRFTERHERLMKGLAGQAAVAIDNARLYRIAQTELDERRVAEAKLRELNDTLEQRVAQRTAERDRMWETSPDLMVVIDFQGVFRRVNPAWTKRLGYLPEELIGHHVTEFVIQDDHAATTDAYLLAAEGGHPKVENRYRHRDGSVRWISWVAAPSSDETYAVGRDVTAEKARRAELALLEAARREADALYRAYFENTAEALFVVNVLEDGGFTIEDLNPAHQSSIGLPLAEVQGKRIDEVLPPELAEPVIAHYRAAIGAEAVYQYREHFELHGRSTYWDTVLVPVRDNADRIVRLIGSSRDLTAQMAAEEQLRQSQKMEAMGQLTGGVAHDFNNLLTPIVGSLDMLMRRGLGNEREQRLIAGAMQSAERAKTLVQRLLAFARRQPLQAAAVDLPQLVSGMAGLIGSTLGPKVDIRVELADDLPPARADANQLEMALLNLAVNARDAMPDGGVLTVSAARETVRPGHRSKLRQGHYVRLSVTDTGTGMDADTLARAIEPFFSTKGVGQGTGLGLSMVHGLAAQLGGGLTITSELGRGTTVELWLPISAEPLADTDTPAATRINEGRGRALLVDDEELVRMSTADMLNDLGYEVIEASSAEEALALLKKGAPPDLIVTDHLMPGMSGAELAREVRAMRPGLPILIVSGYAEVEGIAPDLPRLTKPFRNAELAERLAELRGAASTSG